MNALVQYLIVTGALRTPEIIKAFLHANRALFVPEKYRNLAYEDIPIPIGYGQTISQPTTVAFMIEQLNPRKDEHVLDIGSGSGWTVAILSYIVGKGGRVTGMEIIPELVEQGRKNLSQKILPQAEILQANRENLGYPQGGPYDKILVSASAANLPEELIAQLKKGGRLIIPIGNSIWKIEKNKNGIIDKKEYPGYVFVPLVEKEGRGEK